MNAITTVLFLLSISCLFFFIMEVIYAIQDCPQNEKGRDVISTTPKIHHLYYKKKKEDNLIYNYIFTVKLVC